MKIDDFNNIQPKNIIGNRSRGQENEFNTFLKKERHSDPPEFSSSEVEEYVRYNETMDLRARQSQARRQQSVEIQGTETRNLSAKQSARNVTQTLTKSLVQQVACLAAGAVIVTNTYSTMVDARNERNNSVPEPPVEVVEMVEPEEMEPETVPEPEPETVQEEPQNDSPVEIQAGGNESGSEGRGVQKTKKSVEKQEVTTEPEEEEVDIEDNKDSGDDINREVTGTIGESSGDSGGTGGNQSPAVAPVNHTFDAPVTEDLGGGSSKLTYTCTECGETYVIIVNVQPEQE